MTTTNITIAFTCTSMTLTTLHTVHTGKAAVAAAPVSDLSAPIMSPILSCRFRMLSELR